MAEDAIESRHDKKTLVCDWQKNEIRKARKEGRIESEESEK